MRKFTYIILGSFALLFALGSCGKSEKELLAEQLKEKEREIEELNKLAEEDKLEMERQYAEFAEQYAELKKSVQNDSIIALLDKEQKRAEKLLKELKNVMPYDRKILHSEFCSLRLDEIGMKREHFHAIHHRCPSRGKFIRNGSGTSEKVKHLQTLHLVFVIKDIEKAFLSKIRSRARLISLRRQNRLASELSTDYPHAKSDLRS
mgnify:CR=1 FL=1